MSMNKKIIFAVAILVCADCHFRSGLATGAVDGQGYLRALHPSQRLP